MLALNTTAQTGQLSLDDFRWENRIIIINQDQSKELSEQQIKLLLTDTPGLQERHLLIFEITLNGIKDILNQKDYETSPNLLEKLDLKTDAFEILLIGKDGGVKLRSNSPLDNGKIYSTIDVMPMRRAEMKQQKQ
jgi:hypothetical protein